jgi:hypothetical protein
MTSNPAKRPLRRVIAPVRWQCTLAIMLMKPLIARGSLFHTTTITIALYSSLWAVANLGPFLTPALLLWFFGSSGALTWFVPTAATSSSSAFTLAYVTFGSGALLVLYGKRTLYSKH